MEFSLLEKTNQTRIKISMSEWKHNSWIRKHFTGIKPVKQNSRYIYFVVDGDLLNEKKE